MISLGPMKDSLSRSKGDSMISLAPFVQRLYAWLKALSRKSGCLCRVGYKMGWKWTVRDILWEKKGLEGVFFEGFKRG